MKLHFSENRETTLNNVPKELLSLTRDTFKVIYCKVLKIPLSPNESQSSGEVVYNEPPNPLLRKDFDARKLH